MSDKEMVRVVIVDDHVMVRRGLATMLRVQPGLRLVGEAGNGREALDVCEQMQPDVVLMDLLMPEMGGVEATRQIRARWPGIGIIALSSYHDPDLVREALQAGAVSYLVKNVSADDLAEAIRDACAGRSMLAPEAMQALIQSSAPEPAAPAAGRGQEFGLTSRELEVLALMVQGLNNAEIAERLVVSRSTSKAHVSNILSKMGVSNRAEAIVLALQNKLTPGA